MGEIAILHGKHLLEDTNGDLANGIGNVTSRTVGMITKYSDGKLKRNKKAYKAVSKEIDCLLKDVTELLDWKNGDIMFHQVLAHIWEGMAVLDRYINDNKPWQLVKNGETESALNVLQAVEEGPWQNSKTCSSF